jgi:hypothetical protein
MAGKKETSFWSKPAVRWAGTILLGLVFIVALVVFLAAGLVSRVLMDPELYNSALDESDFYNRIYTDLLADPAMLETTATIMGDLNLDPTLAGNVLSLTTSTLYLVVPPDAIQSTVEGAINAFTSYLTGKSGGHIPNVALDSLDAEEVADRMVDGIMAMVGTLFAEAVTDQQAEIAGYDEEQLADYIAQISEGKIVPVPEELAAASVADLSLEERQALVEILLGPEAENASPATWLQIDAALQAGDLTGAIVMASGVRTRARAEVAAASFVMAVKDSEEMDTLKAIAEVSGQTQAEITTRLKRIQSLIITLDRVIMPLEFVIMVLALGGIVWIHADNLVAMLRTAGLTLIIGSAIVAIGWRLIGSAVGDFLDERFLASSGLPVSLENMIRDVVEMVVENAWTDVWQSATLPLVVGLALLILSFLPRLPDVVNRLLQPFGQYRKAVIVGVVLLIVLVPIGLQLLLNERREPEMVCNGHAELCDRPVNDVAYATTHNGMSITEYDWIWPSHDGSITNQLNAGIRGFLIDTHYWDDAAWIEDQLQDFPPELQGAVLEILDQIELSKEDGFYLCHMMCGLGATDLDETLEEMKVFLDNHPEEIILIVFEDKITPADTDEAFAESGLDSLLYVHEDGRPWPTLRQLIEDNERVLVMAENEAPPPEYYLHAWDYTEETPYHFGNLEEFDDTSCRPNRGDTDKPFFLLNHWITRASPSRVDATILNDYDYLLERAQRCAEERGQIPNLVGVNFYLNGDVFNVVDTLNGVGDEEVGQ